MLLIRLRGFQFAMTLPVTPVRRLISVFVMSVLVLVGAFAVSAEEGLTMRVLWTVSDYHLGKGAMWGKAEAESMLGKPLDITKSTITFDGQTCHDVLFKRENVDAAQYLAEKHQTTPRALGLAGKTLNVVNTTCSLRGFSEYMRLKDGKLIVPINGVLFVFAPAVNY